MAGSKWTTSEIERLKKEYKRKKYAQTVEEFSDTLVKKFGRSMKGISNKIFDLRNEGELDDIMPNILVMDIETLPIVRYAWEREDYMNAKQMIRDWQVLCWAAKWLGDDRIMSDCLTPGEIPVDLRMDRKDKRICLSLLNLFEKSDIVIVQNGKRFDIPSMNSRWWKHGRGRPSSYKIIDTLDTARRVFRQTFNSLNELGKYLGVGNKLKTDMELWIGCDNRDEDSLRRMREYNEQDVFLLERVYEKMRGWIPNHPNLGIYNNLRSSQNCPVCLDVNVENIGFYYASARYYKEYRCGSCRAVWHSTKPEKWQRSNER